MISKLKNPVSFGSTRKIYQTFGKCYRPLHNKLVKAGTRTQSSTDDRPQSIDRIPELPTDRYFLDLSETYLYMVYPKVKHL